MAKLDHGVEISRSATQTARERWCEFYGVDTSTNHFANFLGITRLVEVKNHRPGVIMLRKSAVDKIMLLNSPHWYSILKAYEAQKLPKK
jgi:hypothetical protein